MVLHIKNLKDFPKGPSCLLNQDLCLKRQERQAYIEAIFNGFLTHPHQSNPKSSLHCDLCVDISIYLINCLICYQHIFEVIRNKCSHPHGVIPTITNCPREATVVVNKGKANIVRLISQQ